jgi:hypothetical protein
MEDLDSKSLVTDELKAEKIKELNDKYKSRWFKYGHQSIRIRKPK